MRIKISNLNITLYHDAYRSNEMCAGTVIAAFGWTYVIHYIINVAGHHSNSIESGKHGHIVLVSVVVSM